MFCNQTVWEVFPGTKKVEKFYKLTGNHIVKVLPPKILYQGMAFETPEDKLNLIYTELYRYYPARRYAIMEKLCKLICQHNPGARISLDMSPRRWEYDRESCVLFNLPQCDSSQKINIDGAVKRLGRAIRDCVLVMQEAKIDNLKEEIADFEKSPGHAKQYHPSWGLYEELECALNHLKRLRATPNHINTWTLEDMAIFATLQSIESLYAVITDPHFCFEIVSV